MLWWGYVRKPTTAAIVVFGAWAAVSFYWRPDHGILVALAVALVNGGRRFRAPGVLKTDDRIQELPVGYAACQPFIEQIGYSIALGSNKLAEYEQIRCRIMEILPPHRKECGIPGEVAAIQIPRKTVQVPRPNSRRLKFPDCERFPQSSRLRGNPRLSGLRSTRQLLSRCGDAWMFSNERLRPVRTPPFGFPA